MDDESSTPTESVRKDPKRNDQLRAHYQQIGEMLNISEAGSWRAGIPWLPPNEKVLKLSEHFSEPLEEFVKLSLAHINTNVIELYCEDLETEQSSVELHNCLFIRPISLAERFFFPVIVFIGGFFLAYGGFASAGFSSAGVWCFAFGTALAVSSMCTTLCLEPQRRFSFHNLLYRELLRRRGLDQPNSSRLGIIPAETKPFSK